MNNDWYENRDKRTDACGNVNPAYKDSIILVWVTDSIRQYRVQLLTYLSLTILANWCKHISLSVELAECLLEGQNGSFSNCMEKAVKSVDPFGDFSINDTDNIQPNITLFIGNPNQTTGDFVSINGAGWLGYCAFNREAILPSVESANHIFGCCFAACMGNAELFRYVLGQKSRPYSKWYSLWTNEVYDQLPVACPDVNVPAVDLGRIHLVGCGAIGSSFIFLFPYSQQRAEFLLVDPDTIESQNTSSSLLFNYEDQKTELEKVLVCRDYLSSFGIQAKTFKDEYSKWRYDHGSGDIRAADIILCFANDFNIWSTIQNLYPPLCFHATTSKSWGVHIGRHIPLIENCIVCTFKDVMQTVFIPVCSEGTLSVESSHTAILPFLSPAGAILTLAELLKVVNRSYQRDNTITFNMGTKEGLFTSDHQAFGSCYVCSKQRQLYPKFGTYSKYWGLSI